MSKFFFVAGFCSWAMVVVLLFVTEVFVEVAGKSPGHGKIDSYLPQTITRVYTKKGEKIAEFAYENRINVRYTDLPQALIDAFLAAEDKNFFLHQGIDFERLGVAVFQTIYNLLNNRRAVGASTITQQVVRNLILNNSRNLDRKIREIVLAYQVTQLYSKEKVLELYLNHIFLGNNSYGVAAAAQGYFGKRLDDLAIEEMAVLAALPKAPSQLNPLLYPDKMLRRRNWVIRRMMQEGFIAKEAGEAALERPIRLNKSGAAVKSGLESYVEAVRRQLLEVFGEEAVYTKGFTVIVNVDERLQQAINRAFLSQINEYDRRHGWRGAVARISLGGADTTVAAGDKRRPGSKGGASAKAAKLKAEKVRPKPEVEVWLPQLKGIQPPDGMLPEQQLGVVIGLAVDHAIIGLADGSEVRLGMEGMRWARRNLAKQRLGKAIGQPKEVLALGDVVIVRQQVGLAGKTVRRQQQGSGGNWILEQIPDVNGGVVAIEPYTGNILAMVGGYPGRRNEFNRATQAMRQPGSVFKPLVHVVALEGGMHRYSVIKDAPLTIDMGSSAGGLWQPKNYTENFFGDITLGDALAKSRNLPTVRLTMAFGVPRIMEMACRFGVYPEGKGYNPREYALGLGTRETNLLNMTNAYNTIASHGFMSEPEMIAAVYDRDGKVIYRQHVDCDNCFFDDGSSGGEGAEAVPHVLLGRPKILQPRVYQQINTMLADTVKWGTARALQAKRPIAGKTGSTNSSHDAWFIGYGAQFTVGIYVGFDAPRTLGGHEYGATVALPMFKEVLAGVDEVYPYLPLEKLPSSTELYDDRSWEGCRSDGSGAGGSATVGCNNAAVEWGYIHETAAGAAAAAAKVAGSWGGI